MESPNFRTMSNYKTLLTKFFNNSTIQFRLFSIKINVIENLDKLKFDKNLIIKPIYISNNAILNW